MSKDKKIYFLTGTPNYPCITLYHNNVVKALDNNIAHITTADLSLLSTRLFEKGYRVFIQKDECAYIEVKLGINPQTHREIKMEHNLLNLLLAGEFGDIL